MKKIFFLSFLIFPVLLIIGAGCDDMPEDQQIDYEEDVKPLIEEINEVRKVRGSCNVIAEKSTCLDYVGSMWDQPQSKELNCGGVGIYSNNTCPYTEIGGCQSTGDTLAETVIWMYDYGGNPITKEDAVYAAMSCNAVPGGKWVMPDDFLTSN